MRSAGGICLPRFSGSGSREPLTSTMFTFGSILRIRDAASTPLIPGGMRISRKTMAYGLPNRTACSTAATPASPWPRESTSNLADPFSSVCSPNSTFSRSPRVVVTSSGSKLLPRQCRYSRTMSLSSSTTRMRLVVESAKNIQLCSTGPDHLGDTLRQLHKRQGLVEVVQFHRRWYTAGELGHRKVGEAGDEDDFHVRVKLADAASCLDTVDPRWHAHVQDDDVERLSVSPRIDGERDRVPALAAGDHVEPGRFGCGLRLEQLRLEAA